MRKASANKAPAIDTGLKEELFGLVVSWGRLAECKHDPRTERGEKKSIIRWTFSEGVSCP